MMKRILTATLVAGLFLSLPALALRPLVTDDAPVLGPGFFQWEFGVLNYSENSVDTRNVSNVVTYGWLPRTNLVAEFPYLTVRGSAQTLSGMGDIILKAKHNLMDPENNPVGFSVSLGNNFSNGDQAKGFGDGKNNLFAHAILTKPLPFGAAHANLGYTFTDALANFGAALEANLPSDAKFLSEIAGERDQTGAGPINLVLGLNKLLNSQITMDGGLHFGLTDSGPKQMYTFGLTALM
jgi:hypothetical protein